MSLFFPTAFEYASNVKRTFDYNQAKNSIQRSYQLFSKLTELEISNRFIKKLAVEK